MERRGEVTPTQPRLPQPVDAVVIPDVPGVNLVCELAEAAKRGLRVSLSAEQAKKVVAAFTSMAADAYPFERPS